ncbi:sideroflexin-2 [Culicoides brevitarsis]|uniref:sideroflexin-2 n=1 Tax=Culicoides brevitarsis TaxID=469753 RepID=UPI00307B5426
MAEGRIDVDKPLYDLSTFKGRFLHFAWVTDPRTCVVQDAELYKAKTLVEQYRKGEEPKETTLAQIKYAKKLYESAFHPDTGDLQNVFGRMSFQVPGGMLITGGMLQWYKTTQAVVFWQWINQSFNALVNYTNRNANSPVSTTQLGVAYVSATSSALVTAIGYKAWLSKRASPFFQRYVPFSAVAAANCVNIPLMRQNELLYGIDVQDANGNIVGKSRLAAAKGISQVVFSRIVMAAPGMLVLPIIMERMEKKPWFSRLSALHGPFQVMVCGCFLTFMVPFACAIFPQRACLSTTMMKRFEPELYKEMEDNTKGNIPTTVYFNKGL